MKPKLTIIQGNDDMMNDMRALAEEEGYDLIDARKPWWRRGRWWYEAFWATMMAYLFIANYCRIKEVLGLATTACGCGQ
jgi:hypothetical protein